MRAGVDMVRVHTMHSRKRELAEVARMADAVVRERDRTEDAP